VVNANFRVSCGGGATFYGRFFQCHKKGGHGSVDLREAMEKSCNVYYYTLGNMVGVDKIHKWATLLGLGEKTGIDLPNEVGGLVPSTEWKRKRYNEKWYAGETISVAIGQGQVSITPISQAVMMSTLANGGTRYVPQLLKAVNDGNGWKPVQGTPP
jgi:penicillin-binding protein 2